jgi:transcriptional regulator with XRE-family HTH domain
MTDTAPTRRVPPWTVGDRMRKARIYAGMTTDEMAADIGRTRHTISNYERDVTKAPLLVLRLYALRTQVPLDWLQNGTEDGPMPPSTSGEAPPTIWYWRRLELVLEPAA